MTNVQLAEQKDTVGAVAMDSQGNVAYATSTGGIVGKAPGRVGDSPIVGENTINRFWEATVALW